ncbi:Predicted dehydrogenase [Rathayibacter oskolensis]|uniref:Predicted dehydrogenase n=1 Tax=Rathayibacter oskolensis TaxID=1891671 RepID=A0A1X7PE68_9MICO|nr:Gfo/Idh/MocA family oxidoreductase [Rathayibacter oskolensis]SMH48991.1 Predicted dehydrogenase [Rathayibacter oskolensis]
MTARLRVGLIGAGWVAHQHVAGYRSVASDVIEVAAVCDPREEVLVDFADRYGIAGRFTDAGALITSGEVDALVLLTPPAVRDEIIDPALAAALPLLIEKPFAATGAAAVGYVRAAEEAGVVLAVSQNFRWFPEYQWLERRLREPGAGRIEYLEARSFQNRPQTGGVWRATERRLEMAIYSVHLIDRLQWLAGAAPVSVGAVTRRGRDEDIAGEQFTTLSIEFDDGSVARMTSSWKSLGLPRQDARVDTDRGSFTVARTNPMEGEARGDAELVDGSDSATFADDVRDPWMARSYGYSGREFAEAVLEGREPLHSGRDNLKTMGIMEAAYLSAAREGRPVAVAEALGG